MGMFSKIVLASMVSFVSVSAFADTQVNCVGVKTPTTKLSYVISAGGSKRLASDVTFEKNAVVQIISFLSVAQYAATNVLLYVLTDDFAQNPKLRFTAAPVKTNTWLGAIEEFGASTVTTAVKCTTTSI